MPYEGRNPREIIMPNPEDTDDPHTPTEYAGRDAEFRPRSIMRVPSGKSVLILAYDKARGLYHVHYVDTQIPFAVRPDKLKPLETSEKPR